jgi:hypothetical protein
MVAGPETLFHIIKHDPPIPGDFLPGAAKGQRKPDNPAYERYWRGFSAFDTLAGARILAQRFPKLGDFIAEIAVANVSGVQYERTFGPGHYTVWADSEACMRNVIRVYRVREIEEA